MATDDKGELHLSKSSTASMEDSAVFQDPAALVHEVEHIKELVRLSAGGPQQGISSQIFRRSFQIQSPQLQVPQSQVLRELDSLKRRLKKATGSIQLSSPEDSENEQLSETEADAGRDQHLREIAHIRAELEKVKEEREEWLENAENRIDALIVQKDSLSVQLQDTIERLQKSVTQHDETKISLEALVSEKEQVLADKKSAEDQLVELQSQTRKYQRLHEEASTS